MPAPTSYAVPVWIAIDMRTPWTNLILALLVTCLSAATGCGNARRIEHSVPSLVKTLKEDKDPNMRYWAADSLGKFGPEAQTALPDLVAVLKDENKTVRMGAGYAL